MIADLKPFRQAIIRVTNAEGGFFGVGLLLTPDVMVTCAHVVAQALGVDPETETAPVGEVFLNLPFVDGGGHCVAATTMEDGWFPRSGPNLADIAFLHINNKMRTPTIRFSIADEIHGCAFKAWVGQEGHETQLIDIKGEIGGEIGNGRYHLDVRKSNYKIEPGCSGSPVADTETGQVLGLIAQEESDKTKDSGFLIPASHLRQAAAKARIYCGEEGKSLADLNSWVEGRYQQSRLDQDRVKGFVSHYAGELGNPMPFVGREPALGLLDAWLAQDENRFLLLSSQAGWGKSALLLHWLARLVALRTEVTTLFIPISIRFNTNTERDGLRLFHAALCDVFKGLRFPEDSQPIVDQYRGRLFDAWDRIANRPEQSYLLIVDGIDEAANEWIHKVNRQHELLFPKNLPSNLHILVSARHKPGQADGQAWLADIPIQPAATPLKLSTLPKLAMAEAIIQLGYPLANLADKVAFVDELYKLTDRGDPLLLTLWIGQIWQHRQHPELNASDLRRMKPGLNGFFTYWLGEREAVWQAQESAIEQITFSWLLHVLAFANGPLLLTDLMSLLDCLKLDKPAVKAVVYSTLCAAYQLVAKIQQAPLDPDKTAFIFVHPRLNDYIKEEVDRNYPGRSRQIDLAYITWGKEVIKQLNQNELAIQACPIYLLRHYTEYLAAAEDRIAPPAIHQPWNVEATFITDQSLVAEHWLPLLECGWHQAWLCHEGAWGGFLNDLKRVAMAVRRYNQRCWERGEHSAMKLAAELRIKLIHVSISHLERSVPAELMLELVKAGEWTLERAIRVTEGFSEPERRFQCFAALASVCCAQEKQARLIADALAAAEAIEESERQSIAFATLARLLMADERYSMLRRALDIATGIEDERDRAPVLKAIAPYLNSYPELRNEAMTVVAKIRGENLKIVALSAYSTESAQELERHNQWYRNFSLGWWSSSEARYVDKLIGDALASSEETQRILLINALNVTKNIKDDCVHLCGLILIGRQLRDHQDLLMQALEDADIMKNPSALTEAIIALTPLIKESCLRQKWLFKLLKAIPVISIRDGIEDPDKTKLHNLAELSKLLAGDRPLLEQALETIKTIKTQDVRVQAIAVFAPYLSGDRDLLNRALTVLSAFHDEKARISALTALAPYLLGNATLICQVLETLKSIRDEEAQREGLCTYAMHFCGSNETLDQALKLANVMNEPFYQLQALTGIAQHMDAQGRQRVLAMAQESAGKITENFDRVYGLSILAFHVEDEKKKELLQEILNIPTDIMSNVERIQVYPLILYHVQGKQKNLIVRQALNFAESLGHQFGYVQAKLIANIAPYLARDKVSWKRVINLLKNMYDDEAKSIAFLVIAQYLRELPTMLNDATQIAKSMKNVRDRTKVLSTLAAQMNGEERCQLLGQIRNYIKDAGKTNDYFDSVVSFLPCLQDGERTEALEEALALLESRERVGFYVYSLEDDLKTLAPHLKDFPNLATRALAIAMKMHLCGARLTASASIVRENRQLMDFAVWTDWTHQSPSQREELLNTMESFIFGAFQLGGTQEAPEIARAILDVGKWWP